MAIVAAIRMNTGVAWIEKQKSGKRPGKPGSFRALARVRAAGLSAANCQQIAIKWARCKPFSARRGYNSPPARLKKPYSTRKNGYIRLAAPQSPRSGDHQPVTLLEETRHDLAGERWRHCRTGRALF